MVLDKVYPGCLTYIRFSAFFSESCLWCLRLGPMGTSNLAHLSLSLIFRGGSHPVCSSPLPVGFSVVVLVLEEYGR